MNKDVKTQILLGVAVFLTLMFVMNRFMPPKAEQQKQSTSTSQGVNIPSPQSPLPSNTQLTNADLDPEGSDTQLKATEINDIKVVTKEYTANFSTKGAAMQSFSLNSYYNLPPEKKGRIKQPIAGVIQEKKLLSSHGYFTYRQRYLPLDW